MSRRPEGACFVAAIAVALLACKRTPPAPPADADADADAVMVAPSVTADASSVEAGAARDAAASTADDPLPAQVPLQQARRVKSIGHTSVVLKMEMSDGRKVVFKPHSHRGPGRYKGEIAAYRLATALGLDAVPRTDFRTFPFLELHKAGASDANTAKLLVDEVIQDDGVVRGALSMWIDDYEVLPLEQEPLLSQVRGWLKKGASIPPGSAELVKDASNLFVFDFITGNWDRWSGANVATTHGKMLYVDNDGAFFEQPPKDALVRSRRLVEGIDRFSKAFVERLRSVSDEELARAIGEESPGVPLLSEKALAGVLLRRKQALAIIDAKSVDWLP